MLHDLLRIKKIREDSALRVVRTCRYKVEQAVLDVQKKEKELEEHLTWRKKEEKRLYDEVLNTQVKERELDLLKQRVVLMREKDAVLQEKITEAEKHLQTCKDELKKAQEDHSKARQTVEKFEEFTSILDEEAAKEAARIEDLEMEEFTSKNKN